MFIYSYEHKTLSRRHIARLLHGWVDKRSGRSFYKEDDGLVANQVAPEWFRKEYRYNGVLSDIPHDCPSSQVITVNARDASKLACFFDKNGIDYLQFSATLERAQGVFKTFPSKMCGKVSYRQFEK